MSSAIDLTKRWIAVLLLRAIMDPVFLSILGFDIVPMNVYSVSSADSTLAGNETYIGAVFNFRIIGLKRFSSSGLSRIISNSFAAV